VAAARLADVGAADADPRVALRGGQHVVQKLAVGLLDEGALGEDPVRLGEAGRERVADLLQLAEVEDPRRPGGADPIGNRDPSHPLGDEPGDLRLELADLAAQLVPRPRLLSAARTTCRPPGDRELRLPLLPLKQIRHMQILSRFKGRRGNP
jgi:hypothetical protein